MELKIVSLSQQVEKNAKDAAEEARKFSASTTAFSLEERSIEQQQRDKQLRQVLFGPQPFIKVQAMGVTEEANSTLQKIWPYINNDETHRHLKSIQAFDPLTTDPTCKDYWAWFATIKATLSQHNTYMTTYLLTRVIPPTFADQVISAYDKEIPSLRVITLARLYGQDVYCQLKLNPIVIAEGLRVGRDRVFSQKSSRLEVIGLYLSSFVTSWLLLLVSIKLLNNEPSSRIVFLLNIQDCSLQPTALRAFLSLSD